MIYVPAILSILQRTRVRNVVVYTRHAIWTKLWTAMVPDNARIEALRPGTVRSFAVNLADGAFRGSAERIHVHMTALLFALRRRPVLWASNQRVLDL